MKSSRYLVVFFTLFLLHFSTDLFAQINKDKCNIYFFTKDVLLKDDKYYVKAFVKNNLGFSSEDELMQKVNAYSGVVGSKLAMIPGDGGYKELRLIFNEKKSKQFFEDMLVALNVPVIRVNNNIIPANQLTEFLQSQSKK